MMKALRRGQTMVEYIIIIALVAIAGIGVYAAFAKGLFKTTARATSHLDQQAGNEAMQKAESIGENSIRDL